MNKDELSKVLGSLKNVGNEIAHGVLPRHKIRQLRVKELHSQVEKDKSRLLDDVIKRNLVMRLRFLLQGRQI